MEPCRDQPTEASLLKILARIVVQENAPDLMGKALTNLQQS